MPPSLKLAGQRFGKLVAIERAGKDAHNSVLWLCCCDCGNTALRRGARLTYGSVKSCGCIRKATGSASLKWKGGYSLNGYWAQGINGKHRREHRLIVEQILEHPLPPKAEVHHVDENRINNAHSNLVVCPDRAYHMMLHKRRKAFRECGHKDWQYCVPCVAWKPRTEFSHSHRRMCRECVRAKDRNRIRIRPKRNRSNMGIAI